MFKEIIGNILYILEYIVQYITRIKDKKIKCGFEGFIL